MEKKVEGSWIIHHTAKLQGVMNQQGYEKTYAAGKAGILLSAISSDYTEGRVSKERLNTLASASGINTLFELPTILATLKQRELIDQSASGETVVLGVSSATVLTHTCDIFSSLDPSAIESAAIELAELASQSPVEAREAKEFIEDTACISRDDTARLFHDAQHIGFADFESLDSETQLIFNGNLFRREESRKIKTVLDSLSSQEQLALSQLTEALKRCACIEVTEATRMLGNPLFNKVMAIGLLDVNVVSNSTENTGFVTLPSAFTKFGSSSMIDDAFDLAKAFLSSITYGMTKSTHARGRIQMVSRLLAALIRGEKVGPVAAIGQDYKILEFKGVVSVSEGVKGGRRGPMLKLEKREIGQLALQALQNGDVSEHSLTSLPSAAVSSYVGPEENRAIQRRKQRKDSPKATNDMLSALRTGTI